MGKRNAAVRQYLREIRSWLPCSCRLKRGILDRIKNTIADYLEENPNANYAEIKARFGTPQQIASTYVDEMGTGELLRDLRIRKKILRCVAVAAMLIVALWVGVLTYLISYNTTVTNGYYEISEIEVIETEQDEGGY